MCDTVVAIGHVTADGVTLFGKNSDREPNEPQYLLRIPAAAHPQGGTVKCTYLEIPQVAKTYEVLLSKPFWLWGGEMGVNEYGVAAGNEAVFTRVPQNDRPALLGMDLLRLALERGKTAGEALQVMIDLLETHGQGGNCGFAHKLFYHNSFILADPREAFVFETAGPHWAVERVKDIRTISNGLTIENRWDRASAGLVDYAVARGWCKGREDFSFSGCYSDTIYTHMCSCRQRQTRTQALLEAQRGRITAATVFSVLRDHGGREDWHPARGLANISVCWHAGYGPRRGTQTTGSFVSHLAPGAPTHFATNTAAPCTGIFKPVWTGLPLPDLGPAPDKSYDEACMFWRHEALHRTILRNYDAAMEICLAERDELERGFLAEALAGAEDEAAARARIMEDSWRRADAAEQAWLERIRDLEPAGGTRLHSLAWRGFNREAGWRR